MARSDLLLTLVKTGFNGDVSLFRKTVETIAEEARAKSQFVLADRLSNLLTASVSQPGRSLPTFDPKLQNAFYEITPSRTLDDLVLPSIARQVCRELIEEHQRRDLLRSYNLQPKHRVLLLGPPGNGKTTLAEALAHELMVPMFVVKYEGVITSLLGETAQQLERLFEHVKRQRCVLFFDEFDALSKERGDTNELGEIKRVVNSLLLQIDQLPNHVMIITATNHPDMIDRAAWRRFQAQIELQKPTQALAAEWIAQFEKRVGHGLGLSPKTLAEKLKGRSFAELEQFALDVQRRYVLSGPSSDIRQIVQSRLKQWAQHSHN